MTRVDHSRLVSKLIEKVAKISDLDREVFVITVGDIVECIADVYGKDALKLYWKKKHRMADVVRNDHGCLKGCPP